MSLIGIARFTPFSLHDDCLKIILTKQICKFFVFKMMLLSQFSRWSVGKKIRRSGVACCCHCHES